jgi:arylsulfatase A-like enzyme
MTIDTKFKAALILTTISLGTQAQRPNILFILADDQRADAIGASGNTYIKTPNIDILAKSGVRFSNSYVMGGHHGAISAPSRAMLLSGKSLFHVYDKLEGVHTMPMHFTENGYQTFGTGKWHNGAKMFEASFQNGKNVFIGGMCDHYNVPCQDLGADHKLTFVFDQLDIRDENLAPWPRTPEIIQESLADYYALITHLDAGVGEIIETLKKDGLFDNTIIVYAADNGLAIGSHGLMGKQDLYEHSMKVPVIISGPGIPKDKVSDALVYLYDLFPTLSDLCKLPAPNGVDGKNLVPVLIGKSEGVRNALYTAYRNTARAVRTKEWKLIYYPQHNFTQLFNLMKDPLEISNLAILPEYQPKKKELMALLKELYLANDDTASLEPKTILPLEYDYTKLRQHPDAFQPKYILEKYFKGVDLAK